MSQILEFPPPTLSGEWWSNQIVCGDSLKVMQAMPDNSVHLAITSPPYNVGLQYARSNDNLPYENYLAWIRPYFQEIKRILVDGGRFALNVATTEIANFKPVHYDMAAILRGLGLIMRTEIIWYKQTMRSRTAWGSFRSPSNPHIIPSWEYVLVFSKNGWKLPGDKALSDITSDEFVEFSDGFWKIQPETKNRQTFEEGFTGKEKHPAPFPETLVYRLVKFYSYQNNLILDPFGGSGTTAVVAAKCGRRFTCIDLSNHYCQMAVKRLENGNSTRPGAPVATVETAPIEQKA